MFNEYLEKAKKLILSDDFYEKGEPLNKEETVFLEKVPEWAESWEWIESTDDATLVKTYMDFYKMQEISEVPTTVESLLANVYSYKYIISDGNTVSNV